MASWRKHCLRRLTTWPGRLIDFDLQVVATFLSLRQFQQLLSFPSCSDLDAAEKSCCIPPPLVACPDFDQFQNCGLELMISPTYNSISLQLHELVVWPIRSARSGPFLTIACRVFLFAVHTFTFFAS